MGACRASDPVVGRRWIRSSVGDRPGDSEIIESTRLTARAAGALVLVAFPLWAVLDRLVEPAHAGDFLRLRVAFLVPIAVCWVSLSSALGRRWPEQISLVMFSLTLVPIALMIPRVDAAFEGYLLGYSLVLYGTVFLLISRLRVTIALIVTCWVSATASFAAQADRLDREQVAVAVFYLGTASLLALCGRYYRLSAERSAIAARRALEREQEHTLALVHELDRLSREDPLTGVANRRAWDVALNRACDDAGRSATPFSVVLIDIDGFKQVNDRFGHLRGDQVLCAVAAAISGRSPEGALVARLGGDEFAVLCPGSSHEAVALADDLAAGISGMPGLDWSVTASMGRAEWIGGDRPDDVTARADRDLYRHKAARAEALS